jgi:hypothetical protein
MKIKKQLTTKEILKLTNILSELEISTTHSTGIKNISGGFATADMFDYDNKFIDVELKFGVISDTSHWQEEEQLKIDRKTFEIIN